MTRRLCCVLFVCSVLLVVALCAAAQDITVPAQVGERWDAPTYALHGPYWVGYRQFDVETDAGSTMSMNVWYPALNPGGAPEAMTYMASLKLPAYLPTDLYPYPGAALQGAAPDVTAAPYPVVVFSHGFGFNTAVYAYFAEHLASQGFVVIAPEHSELVEPGDDGQAVIEGTLERPKAITRTLDFAEQLSAASGDLAGMFDMEHVGIAGHSYGGYTALASGGARLNIAEFLAQCATAPEGSNLAGMCASGFTTYGDRLPELAGLAEMPEGLWPSMADPRIDAVIAMAGDAYPFTETGLAELTLPLLAMGGTSDYLTPFDMGAQPAYDYASSSEKALVVFEGAYHTLFGGPCAEEGSVFMENGWQWVCAEGFWDRNYGRDLINHFTTAFLRAELMGDEEARAALAPDSVAFDGVTYSAQGF